MFRRVASISLLAALSIASAGVAAPQRQAPSPDVHFLGGEGQIVRGVRCATPAVGRDQAERVEREMAAHRAVFGPGATPPTLQIPVAFHVVYSEDRSGNRQGFVDPAQVDDQIAVLNAAFRSAGYSFYLASLDYTLKNNWFKACYGAERPMKRALAVDPTNHLNIYTCQPSGGILGFAYLPWSYPEENFLHGVVLLHSSLPGGTAAPYNLGDTATHEVGHYLGLYHTFENGCNAPGDYIDDTPFEATPAYGCPVGRDTCPSPGLDPIFNFMDYTDDACMDEFTGDQGTRMDDSVATYKPGLLD